MKPALDQIVEHDVGAARAGGRQVHVRRKSAKAP